MTEGIRDKIRKLLALSESCNPNEACLAMAKARALMAEHGIDEQSLAYSRIETKAKSSISTIEKYSAAVAAKATNCFCTVNRNNRACFFHIYGKDVNLMLFNEFMAYISNVIKRLTRENAKGMSSRDKNRYRIGVLSAISDRIGNSAIWAVDYEEIERAREYAVSIIGNIRKGRQKCVLSSKQGYLDGGNVSLNRQAVGTNTRQISDGSK